MYLYIIYIPLQFFPGWPVLVFGLGLGVFYSLTGRFLFYFLFVIHTIPIPIPIPPGGVLYSSNSTLLYLLLYVAHTYSTYTHTHIHTFIHTCTLLYIFMSTYICTVYIPVCKVVPTLERFWKPARFFGTCQASFLPSFRSLEVVGPFCFFFFFFFYPFVPGRLVLHTVSTHAIHATCILYTLPWACMDGHCSRAWVTYKDGYIPLDKGEREREYIHTIFFVCFAI